ncbi:hypothetical protein ACIBCT_38330 [Streptosporangium sp. NPDC050855]|uniref:hypothetical protein n=1 Tax=Streptosporangium sp. NPDC050855 TaxID=3366194 RepID=UPI0037B97819
MRSVSRRVLLRGGALGVTVAVTAGCAAEEAAGPATGRPVPPDPETVLLRELIAGKERAVALYASAASERLTPFRQRHEAHLAELRRRLPPADRTPSAAPSAASPGATPTPSDGPARGGRASLRSLRDLERKAAASRVRQIAGASPPLAQLIASMGACEAAHAVALPRSL